MKYRILLYCSAAALFITCAGVTSQSEKIAGPSLLWTADWSADDQYIAVGGDNGKLTIYGTKDYSVVRELSFDSSTIAKVAWHPVENLLAIIGTTYGKAKPQLVQILNVETGKSVLLPGHGTGGRGICWSPDGRFLSTASGKIRIFTREGTLVREIIHPSGRSLFGIDWHPTKNIVAIVEEDIRLFDTQTGKELVAMIPEGRPRAILCLQWHPSGNFLATGDYGHENETGPSMLKFWSEKGELLKAMTGSKSEYRGLRWNKDGSRIATVSDALRVWSKDGELLLTADDAKTNLWGVDWNKQSDKILTAGNDLTVVVWSDRGKLIKKVQ